MSEKKDKMTVLNTGQQRFLISRDAKTGKMDYLEPGEAQEVSIELGTKLLQYKGVKDASKIVKSESSEEKDKIIMKLKIQVEELEAKIEKMLDKKK